LKYRTRLQGQNKIPIFSRSATTFGIALPKWIVSEQYGGWVLGLYTLIFMVVLPTVVVSK
jgi:preprotein translocase subunit Sec63